MCQWRCPGCPSPRRLATDRTHWRRPLSEECTSPPWAVLAGPLQRFPTRTPKIAGPDGIVGNANPAGRSEALSRAQLKGFLRGKRAANGGREMATRAAAEAPALRLGGNLLGQTSGGANSRNRPGTAPTLLGRVRVFPSSNPRPQGRQLGVATPSGRAWWQPTPYPARQRSGPSRPLSGHGAILAKGSLLHPRGSDRSNVI